MTPLLALSAAVAILWALASFRSASARPLAASLAVVVAVDLARGAGLSPRLDLALALCHPAVSAWCAWAVLGGERLSEETKLGREAGAVCFAGSFLVFNVAYSAISPPSAWRLLHACSWIVAVALEVWVVTRWWRGRRRPRAPIPPLGPYRSDPAAPRSAPRSPSSLAFLAVLVLVAGDVAGLGALAAGAPAWGLVRVVGWVSWLAVGCLGFGAGFGTGFGQEVRGRRRAGAREVSRESQEPQEGCRSCGCRQRPRCLVTGRGGVTVEWHDGSRRRVRRRDL